MVFCISSSTTHQPVCLGVNKLTSVSSSQKVSSIWLCSFDGHSTLISINQMKLPSVVLKIWLWMGQHTNNASEWLLITLYTLIISMHILHTVLYTFSKVLTWRICLKIKSFSCRWSFFFILVTLMCDSRVIQHGGIRSLSPIGCKGLNSCRSGYSEWEILWCNS